MITNTFTIGWSNGLGESLSGSAAVTGAVQESLSETVLADTILTDAIFAFPYANLKGVYILATQDVTIFTNTSNGASGNTLTVKTGVPFHWFSNMGEANPFTHDVTAIWIDNTHGTNANNPGTSPATVTFKVLYDTP